MRNKDPELWITNISTIKDISLTDLCLVVRRGKSYNLFDKKHFHLTEKQIRDSIASGSIYKKRDVIKVREKAPMQFKMVKENLVTLTGRDTIRVLRKHIPLEKLMYNDLDFEEENQNQQEPTREELMKAEEQWAAENAEAELLDHQPTTLLVDPLIKQRNKELDQEE